MINQLRNLESFHLSYSLTQILSNYAHSENHPYLAPFMTRVASFVPLIFTSLADMGVHSGTAVIKTLTGIVATPYNFFAADEKALNSTLTLKIALMHLSMAIENLFNAVILPFINLYSTDKANQWIKSRIENSQILFDRIQIGAERGGRPAGINRVLPNLPNMDYQREYNELYRRFTNLEIELGQVGRNLEDEFSRQMHELRGQLQQAYENERQAQGQIGELRAQLLIVNGNAQVKNENIDKLIEELKQANERILDMSNIKEAYQKEIASLRNELEQVQKAPIIQNEQLNSIKTAYEDLKKYLEQDNQAKDEYKKVIEKNYEQYNEQICLLNEEISNLNFQITCLNGENLLLKHQLNQATQEKEKLQKKINERI